MKVKKIIAGMLSAVMLAGIVQFPTVFAAGINVNGRTLNLDVNADQSVDVTDLSAVRQGLVGNNSSNIDVNCDNQQDVKDLIALKKFFGETYGKNNQYSVTDKYLSEGDGVMTREVNLEAGLGNKSLQICFLSDTHYKSSSDDGNLTKMLEFADNYDQIVLGGDMVEHYGVLQQYVDKAKAYQGKIMMTLGSHEAMKYSGTSTEEERYAKIHSIWPHDENYYSKVLENKVMLIQINNGRGKFLDEQTEQFASDLSLAKSRGYKIVLFMHEPLYVADSAQSKVTPLYLSPQRTDLFDYYCVRGVNFNNYQGKNAQGATKDIYEMITQNADTIQGIFCGHLHADFYTEITAKNADGSSAKIPQYNVCSSNSDHGHAIIIRIR